MKKIIKFTQKLRNLVVFSLLSVLLCRGAEEVSLGGIAAKAADDLIAYEVSSDIRQKPCNEAFFIQISQELQHLTQRYGKSEEIAISNNPEVQQILPTLWNILSKKVTAIAARMKVDMSNLTICIQPTGSNPNTMFNAHAQTAVHVKVVKKSLVNTATGEILKTSVSHETSCLHNLTLNAESIRLILWHEGNYEYADKEGLLDGVIAHELGHIFHGHTTCSVDCEFQADTTGAKSLRDYNNLIDAVDMLYFAGTCYAYLHANITHFGSWLTQESIFDVVNIITSSLIRNVDTFGSLSQCSTHTQFSHKIQSALSKAIQRIVTRKASDDRSIATSLLYDELKDACLTPLPSEASEIAAHYYAHEQVLALYSPLTHPDPKSRRMHLISSIS